MQLKKGTLTGTETHTSQATARLPLKRKWMLSLMYNSRKQKVDSEMKIKVHFNSRNVMKPRLKTRWHYFERFITCVSVIHVYVLEHVYASCPCSVWRGQKRASDPLELGSGQL